MSPQETQSEWAELAVVATVSGTLKAEILRAKLESAGIRAVLAYESAGIVLGITADGLALSQVQLLVAKKDQDLARQILAMDQTPERAKHDSA